MSSFHRLCFIVEGDSEERFTKEVLHAVFYEKGFHDVWQYNLSGVSRYASLRHYVTKLCREQQTCLFTTMVDLYGLKSDFPGLEESRAFGDPYTRAAFLERSFHENVAMANFLPHLQLHEFETLLFCDPEEIHQEYPKSSLPRLRQIREGVTSPEEIDDSPETAPSKRIEAIIPNYDKVAGGVNIACRIGLPKILQQCPHFRAWIESIKAT